MGLCDVSSSSPNSVKKETFFLTYKKKKKKKSFWSWSKACTDFDSGSVTDFLISQGLYGV